MAEKQEDAGPKAEPEKWYPVNLGSTLTGSSRDRLYTMRYHFKPASVRSSTSGSVHISGDNEVTMEFHPPAARKPNFVFQGKAEPCKELEAVLFFDGERFTVEKLARSIGSLRHIKQQSGAGMTSAGAERQGGAAVEAERIDSPAQERDGAKSDGEPEERPEVGKKGPKQGGKGPTSQKHPSGRPSGKRKPNATEASGPQLSKSGKKEEVAPAPAPESPPKADPAPADVEHIEEEEVVEEIVEEIIYEEEEARPEAPPRPKAPASARAKSGLVETSSDSGRSSGSGSDDDSDDDDDDEDDDDDDGDDDGSSGSDDDS